MRTRSFFRTFWGPTRNIPPVWLIALIAGLPILSETMYTPALPHIARALGIPGTWVEYTLSVYFFSVACGTLVWGRLSDIYGRKPILLSGFGFYILGCVICYCADSIGILLTGRIIQGLGASVGTVLGQAISHDVFQGKSRDKIFATIGATLALAPAIGPVIGGALDEFWGWSSIFLTLTSCGLFVWGVVFTRLTETHTREKRGAPPMRNLIARMIHNPKVLTSSLAVGISNGLLFSYNAEGPFYLITMLGLTPIEYGLGFTGFAFTSFLGNYTSKRLHNHWDTQRILRTGLLFMFLGTFMFALGMGILLHTTVCRQAYITLTLSSVLTISFGRGLTIANCLALGLEDYRRVAGTATSLFVCSYYIIISLVTTLMAQLHNGTLLPMPLYFLALGTLMLLIRRFVPQAPKNPAPEKS